MSNKETNCAQISIRGRKVTVPAACVDGRTIVVTGKWVKLSALHDEHWQPKGVSDPESFVQKLKSKRLPSDVFTFAQKLPETDPKFCYSMEWDNLAAIPITAFTDWWENRVPQETRKNVRRAGRRGVVTRSVTFDDTLVKGLKEIYDESEFKQGKRFWHYGKDLETVRRENASYLDTCEFIGAYYQEKLIGLLKMVYVASLASIMQIVSLNSHQDKRPMNALIAKAVEICEQKGKSHFIYGQYVYGQNSDSLLTEFKRRNGFEQILVPRYYIPLTAKGAIALKLRLHLGVRKLLPQRLELLLLDLRARLYRKGDMKQLGPVAESSST